MQRQIAVSTLIQQLAVLSLCSGAQRDLPILRGKMCGTVQLPPGVPCPPGFGEASLTDGTAPPFFGASSTRPTLVQEATTKKTRIINVDATTTAPVRPTLSSGNSSRIGTAKIAPSTLTTTTTTTIRVPPRLRTTSATGRPPPTRQPSSFRSRAVQTIAIGLPPASRTEFVRNAQGKRVLRTHIWVRIEAPTKQLGGAKMAPMAAPIRRAGRRESAANFERIGE